MDERTMMVMVLGLTIIGFKRNYAMHIASSRISEMGING